MPFEVCFKHIDVSLNDDGSHVAIRSDQQPLTRLQVGVTLDQALFRLLVVIERVGPEP